MDDAGRSAGVSHDAHGAANAAIRVSSDGRFVYVRDGSSPARIDRVEITTGHRSLWMVLGRRYHSTAEIAQCPSPLP